MRRPSNPSNEGTGVNPCSGTASANEPGSEAAGNGECDRPQCVRRNCAMERVERRGRRGGTRRRSCKTDERLGGGLGGLPTVRACSTPARARAAALRRRRGARTGAALARPAPTGLRRLSRVIRRRPGGDHGGGVRSSTVGGLNRGDAAGSRRSRSGKKQKPCRSDDHRPHTAEPSSRAGCRLTAGSWSGRKLRRVSPPANRAARGAAQRSSIANGTTFSRRSAARSST